MYECVNCRVLVLTFVAVFLAYKLVHLQALIDAYANVMAVDVKLPDTIHRYQAPVNQSQ